MTLTEELAPLVARPWLLVGVGSDLRGDDAFGPLLARRLVAEGLPALDAGTCPESETGPIVRSGAEVLFFADVGHLGAPAGTLRLLAPETALPGGTSTHDPSLALLVTYLDGPAAVHGAHPRRGARSKGPRARRSLRRSPPPWTRATEAFREAARRT